MRLIGQLQLLTKKPLRRGFCLTGIPVQPIAQSPETLASADRVLSMQNGSLHPAAPLNHDAMFHAPNPDMLSPQSCHND